MSIGWGRKPGVDLGMRPGGDRAGPTAVPGKRTQVQTFRPAPAAQPTADADRASPGRAHDDPIARGLLDDDEHEVPELAEAELDTHGEGGEHGEHGEHDGAVAADAASEATEHATTAATDEAADEAAGAEPEALGAETEAEAEAEAETEAEADQQTETEAEARTEAEAGAEAEAKIAADAEVASGRGAEPAHPHSFLALARAASTAHDGEARPQATARAASTAHARPEHTKHGKHGKHGKRRLPPLYARTDAHNRSGIRSNAAVAGDPRQLRRPGVRVGGARGRDIFFARTAQATRYVLRDGAVVAWDHVPGLPEDPTARAIVIGAAPVPHAEAAHWQQERARYQIALNPAPPRRLSIGGATPLCVMTWVRGKGPAWMPVDALTDGAQRGAPQLARLHASIRGAAASRARAWNGTDKGLHHRHGLRLHFFRGHQATDGGRQDRYILPGQSGGANRASDYLFRDVGSGYYNVAMNLPEPQAPPVAVDNAAPGDAFFVLPGTSRQVATFGGKGKHDRPTRRAQWMRWSYGALATERHGKRVPDPRRRGWVPVAVLRKP